MTTSLPLRDTSHLRSDARSMIAVRDLHFAYPGSERPQLDGFSFDAAPGTCTALLGPSGCAKTTVLRLIAGLEQPSGGTIRIDGEDMATDSLFIPAERRRVGLVFQDYALFPHMTVGRNIAFGLKVMPRAARKSRVEEMLATVGLEGFSRRFPHQLSGGQQQRVALARALAPSPRVLLLDEPFSNLDANLRDQVRGEVNAILRNQGITSVLVTHDQQDADALADATVVMGRGGQRCGHGGCEDCA